MGNSSYFRFDDDNKTNKYILPIITKKMGKLKTHSHTYDYGCGKHSTIVQLIEVVSNGLTTVQQIDADVTHDISGNQEL